MKIRKMPVYNVDATGNRVKSFRKKWYGVFSDIQETMRYLPLFEDRKASDEAGRKVARLNELRGSGEGTPSELARYVETMPPAMRNRLAEWGILSASKVAAGKPLAEHLADWKAALLAKGNTVHHADTSHNRAKRVIEGCRFTHWSDLSAGKVRQFLADLRSGEGKLSAASFNYYSQAIKGFCRWMVRDGRAQENPVAHLQQVNTRTDRRHDRRALTTDELRRLLATAANGIERYGMSGADRATLYRLAVETGLRAGELRSLTRGSFALEGDEPAVRIDAKDAKNRREVALPLRADTAAMMKTHLAGKMPRVPAFNLPSKFDIIRMLKLDLADAVIEYRDDAGRVADFHALRHTFISNLANAGVHPKTAQTLARHSTITLTMDRYSHSCRGNFRTR